MDVRIMLKQKFLQKKEIILWKLKIPALKNKDVFPQNSFFKY